MRKWNSFDRYIIAYICTISLTFLAVISQITPVQYPYETQVLKKNPQNIKKTLPIKSSIPSILLNLFLLSWVLLWVTDSSGMFVGRFGLSPTCRIILFSISQTGLCIFCDGTLLSSEFLGEFFWRLLLVKIIPVLMVLDFVRSSTAPDHLELKIQTHMQLMT